MIWIDFFNLAMIVSAILFILCRVYRLRIPPWRENKYAAFSTLATRIRYFLPACFFNSESINSCKPAIIYCSIKRSPVIILFLTLEIGLLSGQFSVQSPISEKFRQPTLFRYSLFEKITPDACFSSLCLSEKRGIRPLPVPFQVRIFTTYYRHNSIACSFTQGVPKPCRSPDCITAANC